QMALRSSSLSFEYICHGIGGRMSRPDPICLPVFIALRNASSDHALLFSPVSGSGVMLAAKEVPQNPLHEVSVSVVPIVHGLPAAAVSGLVILIDEVCPDSMMLMSGSRFFFVVCQS